jgi:hypothetical protein
MERDAMTEKSKVDKDTRRAAIQLGLREQAAIRTAPTATNAERAQLHAAADAKRAAAPPTDTTAAKAAKKE